jgi:TusA-related sulfurtransferase
VTGDEPDAGVGEPTVTVDSRGRLCPLPIIDLARAAADLPAGTVLAVVSDDPAAAADVPAWCRMRGQEYLGERPADGGTAYLVRTVSAAGAG